MWFRRDLANYYKRYILKEQTTTRIGYTISQNEFQGNLFSTVLLRVEPSQKRNFTVVC